MSTKAHAFLEMLQSAAYSSMGESAEQAVDATRKAFDKILPKLSRQDAQDVAERLERIKHLDEAIGRLEKNSTIPSREIDDLRARYTQLQNDIAKGLVERISAVKTPTKLDDPISSFLLSEWRQMVEEAIKGLSFSLPKELVIGTLPTARVNAMTVSVPSSDEYVVIFESQLMPFIGLLAKLCSRALPFKISDEGRIIAAFDKVSIKKHIEQNESVISDFEELLEAYLIVGRPGAARWALSPLGPDETTLSGTLLYSMGTFVLGHEYAHVFANHLKGARKTPITIAGQPAEEVLWQWRQEDQADTYGLVIMLHAMRTSELWLRFWGPSLFFSCTDIVERARAILLTGEESKRPPSSTHPPDEMRHQHIRRFMEQFLEARRESLGPEAERVKEAAASFDEIIRVLWEGSRPGLYRLHQLGKRPLVKT
jgi:hypothetical protein